MALAPTPDHWPGRQCQHQEAMKKQDVSPPLGRIHRKTANQRKDALHKFSRKMVDQYQEIVVGDVSSTNLVKTKMAKSVLDSGWGMLKNFLDYKSQSAARNFSVVSERNTSRVCSSCGSASGPSGLRQLVVRSWICSECGDTHDRDVNAAKNILIGSRCRTSERGNESSDSLVPSSRLQAPSRDRDRNSEDGGMSTGGFNKGEG